ncbi:molybdopterin oxidoreductase family protein [Paremcibacter congregatus]|uniref:molybdopterin oxidoreductase family protein n=1 Tax=Paremcibacter congregatus TaxID=2043170 RepID=UPI0030ED3286
MAHQEKCTHYRACTLCEAICGLAIEVADNRVISIKGDPDDPFSKGHICPKALALKDIQEDPDRLKKPVKKVNGAWVEICWEEAFDLAADRLWDIQQTHGPDAIGVYLGNPNVHNYGALTHGPVFLRLLKSKNRFSATSVDQLPHQYISYVMYGHQFLIPVPDIDHTDHMIIMGANPLASNGSIMTVPDVKGRLDRLKARGGQVIVIDPRRSETAKKATAHHFITPGRDVIFLLAFLQHLLREKLCNPAHLTDHLENFDTARAAVEGVVLGDVKQQTGIALEDIQRMAEDFAAAERAVFYGRMGVSTNPYGALCQWLIQLINIATGNLDRVGGMMIPLPAVDLVGFNLVGRGGRDRWQSRVSGRPEVCGELSASLMAEEILTPGAGQIRAMLLGAGNPILSTPNGAQLDEAFAGLEFMVALDFYITESSRHADLILPPTAPLEHDHYDVSFLGLAVSNVTRFNDKVIAAAPDSYDEWEIYHELTRRYLRKMGAPTLPRKRAPHRLIDMALSNGPYGRRRARPEALSLRKLKAHPHGLYLGDLKPLLTRRLKTKSGKIDCAPTAVVADLKRLQADRALWQDSLVLIGRRHIRSNNSWLHNSPRLVKGKNRCTLLIHPQDLEKHQMQDGQVVCVTSRAGRVTVVAEASTDMMPGVVSLPHGWGHGRSGVKLEVARAHAGVSVNDLTDETRLDELIGTAALNGVPVELSSLESVEEK